MDFSWGDATRESDFVDQEDSDPPLAIEDGTLSDDETPTTQPEQSPENDDYVVPSSEGVETTTEGVDTITGNLRDLDMMEASQREDPNDMGGYTLDFYDPTSDADLENPYMGPLPDPTDPILCVWQTPHGLIVSLSMMIPMMTPNQSLKKLLPVGLLTRRLMLP